MSNDEDDNSAEGEASPPSGDRRLTMMGMRLTPPSLPDLPDMGAKTAAPDDDDFAGESTIVGERLSVDDEVLEAVDQVWEEFFPAETTDAGLAEKTAPTMHDPEHDAQLAADAALISADMELSNDNLSWDDGIDEMSLAEDSLPDAIRDPTPTLEDPADLPPGTLPGYVGDNTSVAEFESGKTEMLDSPFDSDPSVAKLVALDGPASGQEFFASGLRNTVGRGTHNGIVVPDVAMSRQHFEIVRNGDDSYSLIDLQSINGTTLNGTKVREADLFHGDRVEAGKSQFQFVLTGTVTAPSRQRRLVPAATSTMGGEPRPLPASPANSPPPTNLNRIVLGVSVVAVLVSLVLFAVVGYLMSREPVAVSAGGPDPATVYLLGVDAVKSRDWDRAQKEFERARAMDPDLDGVDGQLLRIEHEREAKAALASSRDLIDEGKHAQAITLLEQIPADSSYAPDVDVLLRDARKADVLALYEKAQEAVTNEDHERARELTETLLERVPTHRGALAMLARLDTVVEEADLGMIEEEEELTEPATPDRPRTKRQRPKSNDDDWGIELIGGDKKKSTSKKSGNAASRVPNLTQGFLLYRTRKFKEAERFFAEAAAEPGPAAGSTRKIAKAVKEFRAAYPAGVSAIKAGQWGKAEQKLVAAKRADSVVGDYFDADLRSKLATVEANLGLQRLAKGDAVGARKLLDKAKVFNSSDASAVKLGRELEREARSLYVKAQAVKKTDPAQAGKLCRQVTAILPSSHEVHKDASKLLKSLPSR